MYSAAADRYTQISYARCGRSGLQLPRISLGLWQNFGSASSFDQARDMSSEIFRSRVASPISTLPTTTARLPDQPKRTLAASSPPSWPRTATSWSSAPKPVTSAWPGPYGEWGSRKYLLSSLDQSLMRLGVEYVDIFYSHRFDPQTALQETMGALATAVRSGKALLRRHFFFVWPAKDSRGGCHSSRS